MFIQELKATTDEKITSFEIRLRQLEDELNEEQAKRINAESEVRGTKIIHKAYLLSTEFGFIDNILTKCI